MTLRNAPLSGWDGRINNAVLTAPSRTISEIPKSTENPWAWGIGSARCRAPRRNGTAVKRRPDLPVGSPVKPGDDEH
jgi:hypothetical protein